ncbi:2812_t:CDS:2 [Cetraspora pellucida]|uniref:2812_t:CDS:1 n=1 Tax=Cetraspora pellucida TaxID=1433469 RepID=A0ACA9MV27_9GLOM|nr:2812_t:CDS:2 [Cetraspora pellucida]
MRGHNVNIYFTEKNYHKIKPLIAQRKISEFVNQAVEKELSQTEKQEKEQLRKKLITAYKRMAKNKKLQKELKIMEAASISDIGKKLVADDDDIQNEYDEWIVAVPFTTEDIKQVEPFEVYVENAKENGLDYPSKLQFNYPFTVDKGRFKEYLGVVSREAMEQAKKA